ncbi:hypothetical protein ACRYCC_33020 [Actinomadura scrupuli]|uniref:hypothetical protein n=1 Tax=Actinomadura scrupuli TaxID=559629 RepID=UPI003D96AF33
MQTTDPERRQRAGRVLNPAQPVSLLRFEYDRGNDYENDTGVVAAISALVPEAELVHPDHRFFQLVHLITEYAWVGIHHELCRVTAALGDGDIGTADRLLHRCVEIADLPIRSVRLFEETLPQASMLAMRENLSPTATGLDSPGLRNLRRAARAVWAAFESAIADADTTLTQLTAYTDAPVAPEAPHYARITLLTGVMNNLHRFDAKILEWKHVHLAVVWMLLGGHPAATADVEMPTSLRGRPVSDLERLAVKPLFPRLWKHSTDVYHRGLASNQ